MTKNKVFRSIEPPTQGPIEGGLGDMNWWELI